MEIFEMIVRPWVGKSVPFFNTRYTHCSKKCHLCILFKKHIELVSLDSLFMSCTCTQKQTGLNPTLNDSV